MQLRGNRGCPKDTKLSRLCQQQEAVLSVLSEKGHHTQKQEQGVIKKEHSEDKKEKFPKLKNHRRSDRLNKRIRKESGGNIPESKIKRGKGRGKEEQG